MLQHQKKFKYSIIFNICLIPQSAFENWFNWLFLKYKNKHHYTKTHGLKRKLKISLLTAIQHLCQMFLSKYNMYLFNFWLVKTHLRSKRYVGTYELINILFYITYLKMTTKGWLNKENTFPINCLEDRWVLTLQDCPLAIAAYPEAPWSPAVNQNNHTYA